MTDRVLGGNWKSPVERPEVGYPQPVLVDRDVVKGELTGDYFDGSERGRIQVALAGMVIGQHVYVGIAGQFHDVAPPSTGAWPDQLGQTDIGSAPTVGHVVALSAGEVVVASATMDCVSALAARDVVSATGAFE